MQQNSDELNMPIDNSDQALITFRHDAEETLLEVSQTVLIDQVEPHLDKPSEAFLTQWMSAISPYLKPGGKPVALILSLGAISIPLGTISVLLAGVNNTWLVPILAVGATVVAVVSCLK